MLTEDQVRAMHFARACDSDPDFDTAEKAAIQYAFEDAGGYDDAFERIKEKNLAKLARGQELLEAYSLHKTRRNQPHADWSNVPENALGAHVVESGYIATSPAYRVMYALPR